MSGKYIQKRPFGNGRSRQPPGQSYIPKTADKSAHFGKFSAGSTLTKSAFADWSRAEFESAKADFVAVAANLFAGNQIGDCPFAPLAALPYNLLMMNDVVFQRFKERYKAGLVPWDNPVPPPEVVEVAAELTPGRALDLGCGYGRTAIYLAQRGWQVDGIDFIPQAIAEAEQRAEATGMTERAQFYVASVTDLGFLYGRYQLAIDVGCLHALDEAQQQAYCNELARLLAPGGLYLLFARVEERQDENGPRGIAETAVHTLFADAFTLQKSEIGMTYVEDKSWQSGWFWFIRRH